MYLRLLRAAARGGVLGGRSGRHRSGLFGGLSGENAVRGRIGVVSQGLGFDTLPKILDNRPRAPIVRSNSFMFFFGASAGFNTNVIFFACIRTHGAISST
jgi:hypothetical protein